MPGATPAKFASSSQMFTPIQSVKVCICPLDLGRKAKLA